MVDGKKLPAWVSARVSKGSGCADLAPGQGVASRSRLFAGQRRGRFGLTQPGRGECLCLMTKSFACQRT
jgi:hypothetical protein